MPRNGKLVRITLAVAAAALVASLAVVMAGTASAKSSSGTVNGAGSTFVAPLVTKWMSPVQSQLGLTLNYNAVGSGGGVSAITNKQVDFGASDAPLSQFNPTCNTCVQIPWALAGTAVIYNLGGSLQHLNLTGSVLAQIYLGKITKWNAKAITKLNKGRASAEQVDHRRAPLRQLGHVVQLHRLPLARVRHLEVAGRHGNARSTGRPVRANRTAPASPAPSSRPPARSATSTSTTRSSITSSSSR